MKADSRGRSSWFYPEDVLISFFKPFYNAKMKLQYFVSATTAIFLSTVPTACSKNLRQNRRLSERRLIDPKAAKHDHTSSKSVKMRIPKSSKSADAKAAKAAVTPSPRPSTPSTSECGVYWHRSQSSLNPNSCTNDKNFPEDSSKLYATVRGENGYIFFVLIHCESANPCYH